MSITIGAYFFLIAFILAHLEIQIEGPHGWAEKLPTWRWDSRGVRRWFGKPVTGYHLCLVTLILLFVHVPQLYAPSWEREADLLAMFEPLRAANISLWRGTTDEQRARVAIHRERGPESYDLMFRMLGGHDRVHLAQAYRALEAARRR